jgi:hypothetical protein
MAFVTRHNSGEFRLDGNRFRFIGGNFYPMIINTSSTASITAMMDDAVARRMTVIRTWCFDQGYMPSNSAGNFRYLTGTTLNWREASFVHLDTVLDLARQKGLRLMLTLADNPTYNTKNTYARWSDAIYGTTYFTPVTLNVTSAVRTSNVVTVTTATPHGYLTGNLVLCAGAVETGYNGGTAPFGRFVTVTGANTFTFASTGADITFTGAMTVRRDVTPQAFFDAPTCQQLYKAFLLKLATRVNTINGLTYKDDDTIFAWDLGNEMRYDQQQDPGINGSNSHNLTKLAKLGGWIDVMSTYMKSVDPNHMVTCSSMSHTANFTTGDTISNGTYYGRDYAIETALPNIDFGAFNYYPSQGGSWHVYGVRLGHAATVTNNGAGLTHQLKDFINTCKQNGKGAVVTENGWDKVVTGLTGTWPVDYPLYPRWTYFQRAFRDWFDNGGDGFMFWHFDNGNNYGMRSPTIAVGNDNDDDAPLDNLILQRSYQINSDCIPDSIKLPGVDI